MLLAAELKPTRANNKTQKLRPKEISSTVVKQKVCKNSTNVNPLLFEQTLMGGHPGFLCLGKSIKSTWGGGGGGGGRQGKIWKVSLPFPNRYKHSCPPSQYI